MLLMLPDIIYELIKTVKHKYEQTAQHTKHTHIKDKAFIRTVSLARTRNS